MHKLGYFASIGVIIQGKNFVSLSFYGICCKSEVHAMIPLVTKAIVIQTEIYELLRFKY